MAAHATEPAGTGDYSDRNGARGRALLGDGPPLFKPGSPLWEMLGEIRLFFVFTPALLMQVMHPMIGAAVGDHSVYKTDPWGRARRSLDSALTLVYGGSDGVAEGARLREMHKAFKGVDDQGRPYHALNGEAYEWVHATLFERLVTMRRMVGRPLSRTEEKLLYDDILKLGQVLRIPEREVPPTAGDYWTYFDTMVTTRLENTPTAQDLLTTMCAPAAPPALPRWAHKAWKPVGAAGGSLGYFLTVGTLPPEFRDILGLTWTRTDERRLRAMATLVRNGFPLLPERARYMPKAARTRRTGHWDYGLPAAH